MFGEQDLFDYGVGLAELFVQDEFQESLSLSPEGEVKVGVRSLFPCGHDFMPLPLRGMMMGAGFGFPVSLWGDMSYRRL